VRRSRQALIALAVAGLASAACLALIVVLASRDSGGVSTTTGPGTLLPDHGDRRLPPGAPGPTSPAADPPASGPHHAARVTRDAVALSDDQILTALALGNVVIAYDGARPPAALRRLQRDAAGAFTPDLAAAGQAVILDRRPGAGGVIALAWRRRLRTSDPADPRLRDFVDAWLGEGRA
jgi:Protein of unknown function (DUF3105)